MVFNGVTLPMTTIVTAAAILATLLLPATLKCHWKSYHGFKTALERKSPCMFPMHLLGTLAHLIITHHQNLIWHSEQNLDLDPDLLNHIMILLRSIRFDG